MSLPASWVDEVFRRLGLRYGAAFGQQYLGLDIAEVKADWGDVLGGFVDKPDAIAYALAYLPSDRPVNALQFRDIARRAPLPDAPRLEAPRALSEKAVAVGRAILQALDQNARRHPMQWAIDLRDKEAAGAALSLVQRAMWRDALGVKHEIRIGRQEEEVA